MSGFTSVTYDKLIELSTLMNQFVMAHVPLHLVGCPEFLLTLGVPHASESVSKQGSCGADG